MKYPGENSDADARRLSDWVKKRDGSNTPLVAYTRGKDLSGSLEGAGGIGGLLARSTWGGSSWNRHALYHADGNGNVTKLIDSGSEASVATYRYDPFGNTLSSSGTLADANVYRFSSKEIHVASGMYYYGYRFYDPAAERWVNRDPLSEDEGINLYGFTYNDPIDYLDRDGLDVTALPPSPTKPPPTRPPSLPFPKPKPPTPKPPLPKPPVPKPKPPVRPKPRCFLGPLSIFIGEVLDPPSLGDPERRSCQLAPGGERKYANQTACEYDCGSGIIKIIYIGAGESCKEKEFFWVP